MLRRKAKWTIDVLADESVCISIKSKNINNIRKRNTLPGTSQISTIGNVNASIISCRQIKHRSSRKNTIIDSRR